MSGWLTRRNLLALFMATVVIAAVAYPLFRHMAVKGLQAEAHIMLNYIHSLESAYHIDSNHFISFEQYYGAPILGKDNCLQPLGAEKLGFTVRWCHKEGAIPVRYAYRVIPGPKRDSFRAVAVSGSDAMDQSFVCFGESENDAWELNEQRQMVRTRSCD